MPTTAKNCHRRSGLKVTRKIGVVWLSGRANKVCKSSAPKGIGSSMTALSNKRKLPAFDADILPDVLNKRVECGGYTFHFCQAQFLCDCCRQWKHPGGIADSSLSLSHVV